MIARFVALAGVLAISAASWAQKPSPANPPVKVARKPVKATSPPPKLPLATRLDALARAIEAERTRLGVPGAALVVVQNDRIIYTRGFGTRDRERNLPVTPDTLFAIGSSTKAFTALTTLMAVDDGKLKLSDPPRKFLPYFRIADPETDSKITLRDLLCHRSGLTRTDLMMVMGKLSRRELIEVAGQAKPTAKLGEKFQYQNIMYTAAGEATAQAEHTTWDNLVRTRILAPLGMTATDFSPAAMQARPDFARGYNLKPTSRRATLTPQRDIAASAPAGAINSSVRDMAQWLRFLLRGDGTWNNKRLVSKAQFAEWTRPQMPVAGTMSYGLGWFIRDWRGHKVVEHGGNIDGFNAEVAFMPDEKLGFVLLTNVSSSPLASDALEMVWSNVVGGPVPPTKAVASAPTPAVSSPDAPATALDETGRYSSLKPSLALRVTRDDKAQYVMSVPGQPPYTLVATKGRRYKLGEPAPDGFFVTFRPAAADKSKTELFLEQPQGNMVLTREPAAKNDDLPVNLREFAGVYESDKPQVGPHEVAGLAGQLALLVPGQPAYPMIAGKDKDAFTFSNLPAPFAAKVGRDSDGKIKTLTVTQPGAAYTLTRTGDGGAFVSPLTPDELISKMVAAAGGDALSQHKTRTTLVAVNMVNQGLTADDTEIAQAPNRSASHIVFKALGRSVGTIDETFDGTRGVMVSSFLPRSDKEGRELASAAIENDFSDGLLNAHTLFRKIEITGKAQVKGEEAYIIVKTPARDALPITDYVSTKTFLLLRRDTSSSAGGSSAAYFADYRPVGGVQVAHTVTSEEPNMGVVIRTVKSVVWDGPVSASAFAPPPAKGK